MLGRLTSESNPESGTTSYFYNSASPCAASPGDLVKKSDANGNSICYSYDSLHRLTAKTYSGPNLVNQQGNSYYVYDSATVNGVVMSNAKGRLARAYTAASPTGTKITDLGFSYTKRGEQATLLESTPHSGGYYTVSLTYWPSGALNTLAGLGLPTISYNSDGEGRPTTVTASSGQNPVTGTSYNVSSQVTGVTLGSGDVSNFGFDPNTGRQNFYNEVINGSSISGTLNWNGNGTLKQMVVSDALNAGNNQTCNYTYDDLVRLTGANCGTPWTQTFNYDVFGNINKVGSISWSSGYNAATNRYTQSGTSYDANGNLLNDTFHTYQWNVESRPTTIDSIALTHDAFGRIVEKNNAGVYTQYVYDAAGNKFAWMAGQALSRAFVPLPGGIKAVFSPTASYYLIPDWLGSVRIVSTSTRTLNTSRAFAPFGERYALGGSVPTPDFFTGMMNSTVPDEYDFPARSLQTSQGRWISPDPAGLGVVDPSNPQTWNRYAFVDNNPTGALDPLGLFRSDCVGCNLNGNLGCWFFACGTFYLNGMQVPRAVAFQYLAMGNGGQSGLEIIRTIQFTNVSSGTGNYDPETGHFIPNERDEGTDSVYFDSTVIQHVDWGMYYHWAKNFNDGVSRNFRNEVSPGGCVATFFAAFVDGGLPDGPPGASADDAIRVTGEYKAAKYIVEKGLVVPLRSSIYRGILERTATAASGLLAADLLLRSGQGGVAEAIAMSKGECH